MEINYLRKAVVSVAENERVSRRWENRRRLIPLEANDISVLEDSIHLTGTWRVSIFGIVIPGLLGGAVLGEFIRRRFFMSKRVEEIPTQDVERITICKDQKGEKVYHLFRRREQGMLEVHVFKVVEATRLDQILYEKPLEQLLAATVSADRVNTQKAK